MVTDIVSSTQRAVELGDARWRELLSSYFAVLRKELTGFRGQEVNTSGDGLLATFDGPARAIRCARSIREKIRPLGRALLNNLLFIHNREPSEISETKAVGLVEFISANSLIRQDDLFQKKPGQIVITALIVLFS